MEQKKAPLDLGLKMLENYKIVRHNEFRFISSEFGFVNSFIKMEPSLFAFGQPYRIKEGRIALVKQGVARVSINLIEHNLQAGNLSLMTPTSIIQVIEVSPDFDMQMIAIDNNLSLTSSKKYSVIINSAGTYTTREVFQFNLEHSARTSFPPGSYTTSYRQPFIQYRIYS